jgi:periplasmic protein CpxP/Spy
MEESENPMEKKMFRRTVLRLAVLVLGTVALTALPAIAQDPSAPPSQGQGGPHGRGGMGGEHRLEFLTKKLNLTPDQVTQVKAIDTDSWSQMKALHENTSMAEAEKHTQMASIHKASQEKFLAVLTEDQKTKYAALQEEMKERRGDHGGGQGGPPPTPQL